jgi:hypothetical protein
MVRVGKVERREVVEERRKKRWKEERDSVEWKTVSLKDEIQRRREIRLSSE